MWPEALQEGGADAADAIEVVDGSEAAYGVAVGDDARREGRPNARQTLELGCARAVQVERCLAGRARGGWCGRMLSGRCGAG